MDNMQIALTLDLKQFYASLEKIEGVSKETVSNLQQMFGKVPSVQVPFDAKEIRKGFKQIDKGSKPAIGGMNRAAQSAQTLNYIMRDSPYFFQNFNMGMMAVGNNLNPFIDQLILAKKETGSWRGALTNLSSGLSGIGGISFIFSTIVTAITAYSLATSDAKKETKDLKTEIDELRTTLEKASYETLKRAEIKTRIELIEAENKLLKEQTEEYNRQRDAKIRSQVPGSMIDKSTLGSEETKAELKSAQERLDLIKEYQNQLGLVGQQENRIAELREIRRHLRDQGEIDKIDAQILAYEKLYKKQREATDKIPEEIKFRREHLGLTNEMIRSEIALIDARLADPTFKGNRVQELKNRIELQKLNTKGTKEYIETFAKVKSFKLNDKFAFSPIESVPKPKVFQETNSELERMLFLSNTLTDSFNEAGNAVSSAMGDSVKMFKQANSLAQIFINTLIEAAVRAAVLKGIMFLGGLIFGGPAGAAFAAMDNGGYFSGVPGKDKNLARLSDGEFIVDARSTQNYLPLLHAINNTPAFANGGLNYRGGSSSSNPMPIVVEVKGNIKGRTIQLVLDRESKNKSNIR